MVGLCASSLQAATFTVTVGGDSADAVPGDAACDDGSGNCSVRAAIEEANALAGPDDVSVPAGTYVIAVALPVVTDSLAVVGDGAKLSILGSSIPNALSAGADLHLTGVTLHDISISGFQNVMLDQCTSTAGVSKLNTGTLTVLRSTVPRIFVNSATSLLVENSTVSGGQGISVQFTPATIRWSTIVNNTIGVSAAGAGPVLLHRSIVTGNGMDTTGGSISGISLVGTFGDMPLGSLQDNGGPTPTHALLPVSSTEHNVALVTGGLPDCPATDQRGVARPVGGCDYGAYELAPCAFAPATGCTRSTSPVGAILSIANPAGSTADKLLWKWGKGAATSRDDFDDPAPGSGGPDNRAFYSLCLWDNSVPASPALLFAAYPSVAFSCSGKPCWKASGGGITPGNVLPGKGLSFFDKTGSGGGITSIKMKEGSAGKASILVKGAGANLPLGTFPAAPSVDSLRLQLIASNGACWESEFGSAGFTTNLPTKFKAKGG